MTRVESHELTATELERGWVEHHCDKHGFLVAMTPRAKVTCVCGLTARIMRSGRILGEDLRPTRAKARKANKAGNPVTHACGECGEDFFGKTLLRRHRVGGRNKKRCLDSAEMQAKGWRIDRRGKWRGPGLPSRQGPALST